MAIGLPLRNLNVLTNLLEGLYNPASPNYRKFLTPEQFTRRFGPTEEDYQAVVDFARTNGLIVTGRHPNRLLLDVNGSASTIERALHLKLRVFQHPSEQRAFFAPDSEPSLDSRLPVLSISGLDDFFLPRPMDLRRGSITAGKMSLRGFSALEDQSSAVVDATGSGPSGTFIGLDFRTAYAPGVSLDGAGQSVGLLALDNYYPSDVTDYEDLAGLPRVPITNVLVNGFNRLPGLNNGEVALDIEMAISMAPGLSQVIVYMGAVPNDVLNRMATDNLARQLSSSWSFGNQVDPARQQIYMQFAAQGQTMFQASGDSGAYGPAQWPPADDPYLTAVGGTVLTTDASRGAWSSETAWFGSGGGISANYPAPAWQRSVSNPTNQGSATMRNVPDVAGPADATIWVVANNGQQGTVGGTSVAAPLWAGFAALVNQQAAANHQPPIGFLNPAIYAIGLGPAYSSAFHDIGSGNNTNSQSPSRFFAAPGYDLCTGWGTPTGSNLITALLAPPDAFQITPGSNQVASGSVGGPFAPAFKDFSLFNAGLSSLSWTLGSTSAWLSFSATAGVLQASSSTNVSFSLTAAVTGFQPGSYSADVRFTNLNSGFSQMRRVTINVVTLPVITVAPVNQTLPAGAPAQFSVQTLPNAMLSFQWQSQGSNLVDGATVSGASTATLQLKQITQSNAGPYSVLVTNMAGSTLSPAAILVVTSSAPVIFLQPLSQTVLPGADASFTVAAYGDPPLMYRWRANGTNLFDGTTISGATSNTLTLHSVSPQDALSYSVVVSNSLGFRVSADAQLGVPSPTSPEFAEETIRTFKDDSFGTHPVGLMHGLDGAIYGVTQHGGSGGAGTMFQLDPKGPAQLLHSFNGLDDGDLPNQGLIQTADRTLFGTTFAGGTNAFGTLFKLSPNHQLTSLFMLDHTDGVLPAGGLVRTADGSLYGTASEGGVLHYGTVFRFSTNNEFTVLFAFDGTNGAFPRAGLLLGRDGNFYGTTYKAGAFGNGTIFKISPAGLLTTLASFNGTNGAFPVAELVQDLDGSFLGTTTSGGTSGLGNVFRLAADRTLTNLVSFTGSVGGSHPRAGLLQGRDGNWYGTTSDGGSFGAGTVFRITPDGFFTTISEFNGHNGANPDAPLIDNDGSLLGTARNGGQNGQGVIFQLSIPSLPPQITSQPASIVAYVGSTVFLSVATLASSPFFFQWHSNGSNSADVANVSGSTSRVLILTNIAPANSGTYSVTVSNAFGTVTSAQATVQVLSSAPFITLQPTNQLLNPGAVAIFKTAASGNQPLHYQWQKDGTNLIESGNVLGSTTDTLIITNVTEANNGTYTLSVSNTFGSTNSFPALLSVVPVTAPNTRLTTLYWFTGGSGGRAPSELSNGHDGCLYGTTRFGGAFHSGTVFRISTNGLFSTLAAFNQTNGALPLAGLVRATNGIFYGTTSAGGSLGLGTIFSISSDGGFNTVRDLTDVTGSTAPSTTLIQGSDGNLYGSASEGGDNGFGTIFCTTSIGNVSTLYSFTGGQDAGPASGALLETGDAFFGLTSGGGAYNQGRIFRLAPGGFMSTLYSFTGGTDGYDPVGTLVQGDDSSFYGVTRFNTFRGFTFYGTIFKVDTNGLLNTLYVLNFSDGALPAAGLVLGGDGNFYGTTEQGGATDNGTVFRMTPSGAFSTLVDFDGFNDGAAPLTALTQGPDGSLYGTTSKGGVSGFGTIFRLAFSGAPQITQQPVSQTASTGASIRFTVAVSGGSPFSYQWQKNAADLSDSAFVHGASTRVLTLTDLTLADAGNYSVIVTNASGAVSSFPVQLTIKAAAPLFKQVSQSQGNLLLTWSTVSGRSYQLQSRSDVTVATWTNVGTPLIATGLSLQTSVPVTTALQFYRVAMLP